MCNFSKNLWKSSTSIKDVNQTEIILIPKVYHPTQVHQFRTISICNYAYKCLSKVVVNRLKECLYDIIGPFQTSFIPWRSIQDNVVLAHELVHSMNRRKGKVRSFVIKDDLAKAYDNLSWIFVHKALTEVGLPRPLIQIIMDSNFSVRWPLNRMKINRATLSLWTAFDMETLYFRYLYRHVISWEHL